MASTVRISEEDKKNLESLINYIAFKTNRKVTQEEMIGLLVKAGTLDKDDLVSKIQIPSENNYDWQSDPIFAIKKVHMGKNASQSVEKDLYGR